MDEAPVTPTPTIYRYEFFARVEGGINPTAMIAVISPLAADSPELRGLVDQLYTQLVRQHGIGIPRPAYYTATEMHPLASAAAPAAPAPTLVVVPKQNGHAR